MKKKGSRNPGAAATWANHGLERTSCNSTCLHELYGKPLIKSIYESGTSRSMQGHALKFMNVMKGYAMSLKLNLSRPARYLALGIHTTGLDPQTDRICSLTAQEMSRRGGNWMAESREHIFLFNPQRDVPRGASIANRFGWQPGGPDTLEYGCKNLALQLSFEQQADLIKALVQNDPRPVLAAHAPGFVLAFLDAELERVGLPPLSNDIVDVGALVHPTAANRRRRSGLTEDNSLKGVAQREGVPPDEYRDILQNRTTATSRAVASILRNTRGEMAPFPAEKAPHRLKSTAPTLARPRLSA